MLLFLSGEEPGGDSPHIGKEHPAGKTGEKIFGKMGSASRVDRAVLGLRWGATPPFHQRRHALFRVLVLRAYDGRMSI